MDRAYDDKKRFEYFFNKKWRFIIRGKKNRNLYYKEHKYKVNEFAEKKLLEAQITETLNIKDKQPVVITSGKNVFILEKDYVFAKKHDVLF